VAGLADRVSGETPQSPLTPYARVKAALEDECVRRAAGGLPVTAVRLAPVHGAGKERSASLMRLSQRSVIPLPASGKHSIGFVLLKDALRAVQWLAENPAPAVVAVGGGPTPLRDLLRCLAWAQRMNPRFVSIPLPTAALRKVAPLSIPDPLHWLLRLSLPREVAMDVPVPITPLAEAAAMLVATC
jgi:nucleoside-diphosphate-sugar epimerase